MITNTLSDKLVREPRNLHTPISVVAEAISVVMKFWVWAENELDDPEKYFIDEIFEVAFNDPETNGDQAIKKIGTPLDGSDAEDGSDFFVLLRVMHVVVDYSVQAMKAENNDEPQMAWSYACDAKYWAGILYALYTEQKWPNPLPENASNAAFARWQSENGKKAADVRHSKPGGTREKRDNIRSIWASGKYTSRDVCAEQECAALNMSFSTARKALRNTPDHA